MHSLRCNYLIEAQALVEQTLALQPMQGKMSKPRAINVPYRGYIR